MKSKKSIKKHKTKAKSKTKNLITKTQLSKEKGLEGEKKIKDILIKLDKRKYKTFNDIMIEVDGKTSQIDHIVVSEYGVFILETKNYSGWIFGEETQRYWTQVIFSKKRKFYNPIVQNDSHIRAIRKAIPSTNTEEIPIKSIIVFTNGCEFKTELPEYVIQEKELHRYITSFKNKILSKLDKEYVAVTLEEINITDVKKREEHIKQAKSYRKKY